MKAYLLLFLLLPVFTALSADKKIYRIDVRSAIEYKQGHIKDAINIPHKEVANKIDTVTSDKSVEIRVYCAAGHRAGLAKKALEKLGYTNVINEGGYTDLKKSLKEK